MKVQQVISYAKVVLPLFLVISGITIICSLKDLKPECGYFRKNQLYPKSFNGRVLRYYIHPKTKLFTIEFGGNEKLEMRCGMIKLFKEVRVGDSVRKEPYSYQFEVIKMDTALTIDVSDSVDYESLPRIPD